MQRAGGSGVERRRPVHAPTCRVAGTCAERACAARSCKRDRDVRITTSTDLAVNCRGEHPLRAAGATGFERSASSRRVNRAAAGRHDAARDPNQAAELRRPHSAFTATVERSALLLVRLPLKKMRSTRASAGSNPRSTTGERPAKVVSYRPKLVAIHERSSEGEGFEPPVPFRVQWFSRPPPSTARPSLRTGFFAEFATIGLFSPFPLVLSCCILSGRICPFAGSFYSVTTPAPVPPVAGGRKLECRASSVINLMKPARVERELQEEENTARPRSEQSAPTYDSDRNADAATSGTFIASLRLKLLPCLDRAIRRAFEINRELCGIAEHAPKLDRRERDDLHRFRDFIEHRTAIAETQANTRAAACRSGTQPRRAQRARQAPTDVSRVPPFRSEFLNRNRRASARECRLPNAQIRHVC